MRPTDRRPIKVTDESSVRVLPGRIRVLYEEPVRTTRGALHTVQVLRHRDAPHYTVRVRTKDGQTVAERMTDVLGNAAMIFEAFMAGVTDFQTRVDDLPSGLSTVMGRAWLASTKRGCPGMHVVGAVGCFCPFRDGVLRLLETA